MQVFSYSKGSGSVFPVFLVIILIEDKRVLPCFIFLKAMTVLIAYLPLYFKLEIKRNMTKINQRVVYIEFRTSEYEPNEKGYGTRWRWFLWLAN